MQSINMLLEKIQAADQEDVKPDLRMEKVLAINQKENQKPDLRMEKVLAINQKENQKPDLRKKL